MTDKLTTLPAGSVRLNGIIDEKIRLITDGVLKTVDMYALADYFRNTMNMFATGEFWGKIMRASCLVYRYSGDKKLREIIDRAADDMLSVQRPDGCISTCPDETQPKGSNGSDMWERKYALMGLLEYYDISHRQDVLNACVRLVHYTADQIGEAPGKTPITETGWAFFGIESSSILEPLLRVHRLTGDKTALDLANYIINSGCCKRENIFKAIRDGKSPYQIGSNGNPHESIAKAYEMMSCFEGLVEYYRITGNKEALDTASLFWDKVSEEEITILGSGGADAPFNLGPGTGEQWNLTAQEQTNPDIDLMMETCVTVYWMRLCHQMLRITGDCKYADALEVSIYNAILGAIKPDGLFFEYFPRFNGKRNPKVNYSFNIKGYDLSCCTANGPTGLAMAPYIAFMQSADGAVVNFYENGSFRSPSGNGYILFEMVSEFPRLGMAKLKVKEICGEIDAKFVISLRVPSYARNFTVMSRGSVGAVNAKAGAYLRLCGNFTEGDEWLISFDIPIVRHPAPHGSNRAGDSFEAFTYGAILLARDSRFNENPSEPLPCLDIENYRIEKSDFGGYLKITAELGNQTVTFCDYQSAGNSWDSQNTFASWLPTKG